MKKCLLVINGFSKNPNNGYKVRRLTEEFSRRGVLAITKDAIDLLPLCMGDEPW